MKLLRKEQSLALWCFSASLLLSGCGDAGPECGSLDTRNSVVKIVSDDNNHKLVDYAVKNSSSVAAKVGDTKSEAGKLGIWEKARQGAVYRLDDTILMNSRNRAAQEVTCIGVLYVTVADAAAQDKMSAPKALKSLTFTVLPKLARCAAAYGDGRTDNLTPYSENGPDHSEARSVPGYIRPNSIRFQFS